MDPISTSRLGRRCDRRGGGLRNKLGCLGSTGPLILFRFPFVPVQDENSKLKIDGLFFSFLGKIGCRILGVRGGGRRRRRWKSGDWVGGDFFFEFEICRMGKIQISTTS